MKELRPITILLVDDNEDHATLAIDSFTRHGVKNTVIHLTDGDQVLDFLESQSSEGDDKNMPDLILLDIKMPHKGGMETLADIRKHPQFRSLPVVMLTTSASPREVDECYRLGANSYITKPVQFSEFSKKLKEINLYWVCVAEMPRGD